jgi:hypothetical protein
MTVSKLRTELSDAELVYFAAYYQLKGEEEKKAMDRAKARAAVRLGHCVGCCGSFFSQADC